MILNKSCGIIGLIWVSLLLVSCNSPQTTMPTPAGVLVLPEDYASGIGGFLQSMEGRAFTILVSDVEGRQALLEVKGGIEWDGEGKITEGAESVFRIQTNANPEHWYEITDLEIVDGLLVLTAEEGVFTFFTEGWSETPVTRAEMDATINEDGDWEGQASFIITGFNHNFGALIYQDTRNYAVQQ